MTKWHLITLADVDTIRCKSLKRAANFLIGFGSILRHQKQISLQCCAKHNSIRFYESVTEITKNKKFNDRQKFSSTKLKNFIRDTKNYHTNSIDSTAESSTSINPPPLKRVKTEEKLDFELTNLKKSLEMEKFSHKKTLEILSKLQARYDLLTKRYNGLQKFVSLVFHSCIRTFLFVFFWVQP